ncbi:GlxA family transcriptional regulator [Paraburkholderia sp. GAS199]|uniref:GlxA family transcriptional regulator n=1 Tax=Paraburkholderia sp. GAS199 TaxID=3035126 RepID=UPI003D23C9E1
MLRIGIVLYPGFQLLNLAITSVFEFANITARERLYEFVLLSESGGPTLASSGLEVITRPFDGQTFDTVLVVGDNDVMPATPALTDFLRASASTARRVGATCTGTFNLAQAGLLDDKRVTTHWMHVAKFRREYPRVKLEDDRIFVIDGSIWTSAGATACIDLALALIEKDQGIDLARLVAKKLVVYHRRAGGQSQFSAMLDMEPRSDRIQKALTYAKRNLNTELSVGELASAANLSPRQFSRAFREEIGQTPAKAVEHLRTEAARLMLESGRHPIGTIAKDTGFGDPERMRRAFLRMYGLPPQVIRRERRIAPDALLKT